MTIYNRYLLGQEKQVYQDIYALGQDAFVPDNFLHIEKVLIQTFQRVSYNLEIIYSELKSIDYLFISKFEYNFQQPLIKPLANTEKLLTKLENAVQPFGFLPLSLKMFYRIVGACNFGWDYITNKNYLWQFADPIQIVSLDDLVEEVTNEDYLNELKECYELDGFVSLELSADYFHKDNTSGGAPYSLKLTEIESIDGQFLNEEHDTTFINYLRICLYNCGFSRITNPINKNDYHSFFAKVKPQLKPI